jgi:hypothetical protein
VIPLSRYLSEPKQKNLLQDAQTREAAIIAAAKTSLALSLNIKEAAIEITIQTPT